MFDAISGAINGTSLPLLRVSTLPSNITPNQDLDIPTDNVTINSENTNSSPISLIVPFGNDIQLDDGICFEWEGGYYSEPYNLTIYRVTSDYETHDGIMLPPHSRISVFQEDGIQSNSCIVSRELFQPGTSYSYIVSNASREGKIVLSEERTFSIASEEEQIVNSTAPALNPPSFAIIINDPEIDSLSISWDDNNPSNSTYNLEIWNSTQSGVQEDYIFEDGIIGQSLNIPCTSLLDGATYAFTIEVVNENGETTMLLDENGQPFSFVFSSREAQVITFGDDAAASQFVPETTMRPPDIPNMITTEEHTMERTLDIWERNFDSRYGTIVIPDEKH
ncbi:MAG: hypothetical protein KJ732_08195 [Candidatus Margulisbacteria bacterium]|nr:hypothetical protein [Candidatus Margulisiibacteriota bacterium]